MSPSLARGIGRFSFGIFTRNLPAKVAALVLAVIVWFTVRRDLNENQVFRAEVVTQLAPELMPISLSDTTVKVEFEGPAAVINDMPRDPERAKIVLPVTLDDLSKQLRATRVFTVEGGRIRHGYGDKVRIVKIESGPITLEVAVRGEETKPLKAPLLEGLPGDWEAKTEILTPEVRLEGPQDELDRLAALVPRPIEVGALLANEEENEVTITPALKINSEDDAKLISLAKGEQMQVRITFRRSGAKRELTVPFFVYTPNQDWPVTLVPSETDKVKPTDDGSFTIRIEFTGLPSELDRIEEWIERKEVWAYVVATDFPPYMDRKAGESGPLKPYLRMPQVFWGKVKVVPPPRSEIYVQTLER